MLDEKDVHLKDARLAVLIDADNVPRRSIKRVMEEIAVYGNPTVKRVYGDFSQPQLSGWKEHLLESAITPVQHFGYTTKKNSTDGAMIIDAMDILYGGHVDGFCIVSSDSDFTRLALRLRESGMKVYGFGEKKTPKPFIASCDKFIYVEVLGDKPVEADVDTDADDYNQETAVKEKSKDSRQKMLSLLTTSIHDIEDEDGWTYLAELGNLIIKKQPDFDPRNYGCRNLSQLVKSIDIFEIDERKSSAPNIKHIYVRVRVK